MFFIKYQVGFLASRISSINKEETHPAFTCPKLTMETLEQGVKYVQIFSFHSELIVKNITSTSLTEWKFPNIVVLSEKIIHSMA